MTPKTQARIERAVSKIAANASVIAERNDAIRAARSEGASFRQIAAVAAMTPMAVRKIINKANQP